jgi:ParB family chromosome partitioning protein
MEKKKVLGRGLESLLGARRSNLAVAVRPDAEPAGETYSESVRRETLHELDGAAASAESTNAGTMHAENMHDESTATMHAEATNESVIDIQAAAEARPPASQVVHLNLDVIDSNPYQTRTHFDEAALNELAASIRAQGVLQPVVVRPGRSLGRYLLVLGERRMRASKLAGLFTVPAMVKKVGDQQAAELTVIENLQREDLNCVEQGEAFRVLSVDFRMTQAQVADRVGLSRESVANYIRILKLPDSVKTLLAEGVIRFSEARELVRLENDEDIVKLADEMVKHGMQINQLRSRVTAILQQGIPGGKPASAPEPWVDPNVRAEQTELERVLGLRVKIRDRDGKGKIEISYGSVGDYERVVELLRGKS